MTIWTQQFDSGDLPQTFTDPTNTTTRGAPATWIQAVDATVTAEVTYDGGATDTLTLGAGQAISARIIKVTSADESIRVGNGAMPVLAGGAQGSTGPTGPTGATGPSYTADSTARTSAFTAAIGTAYLNLSTTGGTFAISLPAITAGIDGKSFMIASATTSTTAVVLTPDAADHIDNGATGATAAVSGSRFRKEVIADYTNLNWLVF